MTSYKGCVFWLPRQWETMGELWRRPKEGVMTTWLYDLSDTSGEAPPPPPSLDI